MGVKHTVLPDGQLPTVAFTVLAQLRGQKLMKVRWAPPYSPKLVREGSLTLRAYRTQESLNRLQRSSASMCHVRAVDLR